LQKKPFIRVEPYEKLFGLTQHSLIRPGPARDWPIRANTHHEQGRSKSANQTGHSPPLPFQASSGHPTQAATQPATPPPQVDAAATEIEITKPRNDKREYRRVVLPNALELLLVSDPDTDKV
jgi:hypothetical protein